MSELSRRLVHVSGSIPVLGYVAGVLMWTQLQYLVVAGSVVAIVLEFLRLSVGLDWRIYDRLTREYEQENVAGYALYVFSGTAVVLVFDPVVAVPGVLMLALGDPVSGVLGSNELRETRALPIVAMFTVCLLVAVPFTTSDAAGAGLVGGVVAGMVGAAGATLADSVKPVVATYVVDDNLTIPPVACAGIWLVLQVA